MNGDTKKRFIKAKWCKRDRELVFDWFGFKRDTNYIMSCVITAEVVKELESRGFDIKTLKFYIEKTKPGEDV